MHKGCGYKYYVQGVKIIALMMSQDRVVFINS